MGGPVGGADPADRDRRRSALLARISDPALDRTPLRLPSVVAGGVPAAAPPAGVAGAARTDAERRFERVAIPATVLAGISALICVAVAVAMAIGWSGAVPLVLLIGFGVVAAVLAVVAGRAGAATRRESRAAPAVVWRSRQPWLGPLANSPERRLVGVAGQAAGRIVAAPAWRSPALDDHRLTLDLTAELDQIDTQAYALAAARYPAGGSEGGRDAVGSGFGGSGAGRPVDPAARERWFALLDHVAALEEYSAAVQAAGIAGGQGMSASTGVAYGPPNPAGRPALTEAQDQQLAAGAVRDEFATDHLRQLTADLRRPPWNRS